MQNEFMRDKCLGIYNFSCESRVIEMLESPEALKHVLSMHLYADALNDRIFDSLRIFLTKKKLTKLILEYGHINDIGPMVKILYMFKHITELTLIFTGLQEYSVLDQNTIKSYFYDSSIKILKLEVGFQMALCIVRGLGLQGSVLKELDLTIESANYREITQVVNGVSGLPKLKVFRLECSTLLVGILTEDIKQDFSREFADSSKLEVAMFHLGCKKSIVLTQAKIKKYAE